MHVGWAALFAPPPGHRRPPFEQLRDHIAGRLPRAPRYRQKLAGVPLGVSDPVWVDDEDFDVRNHVRRARERDFTAAVDRVMSEQLDRDRPLWEAWIACNLDDGRMGVIAKAHHCMVDGLAAVELASLLVDPTPEPSGGDQDSWDPDETPGRVQLLAEGLLDRTSKVLDLARGPASLVRHPERLRELPEKAGAAVTAAVHSFRPAPSESVLNEPTSPLRHLAATKRPFDELRTVKRHFGTTVNDVVLAVVSGGIRSFLKRRGEPPVALKAMVPVSLRGKDEDGDLGNRISFVFVDLPCDEPDPVRRLRTVSATMDDRKGAGEPEAADLILDAAAHAPRALQQILSRVVSSPRTFNLTVSNIPGLPGPLYMLGCRLEEVYPVVPIADGHAVSIGVTTTGDGAFFGLYADRRALPDADQLAEDIDSSLDELLALSGSRREVARGRSRL
jgi:WS/DGAT/MGAT family acyltransferase